MCVISPPFLLATPRMSSSSLSSCPSGVRSVINPPKGIINTATAIPKGILNIVGSIHEGFANLPKAYGSDVRQAGKVTDFSSGIKEGAKGLFYGCRSRLLSLSSSFSLSPAVAGARTDD